jgi:hypothetical protein
MYMLYAYLIPKPPHTRHKRNYASVRAYYQIIQPRPLTIRQELSIVSNYLESPLKAVYECPPRTPTWYQ